MKNIYRGLILCAIILASQSVYSQTVVSGSFLSVNNVNASFHPVGNQFWDFMGFAKYEVPVGSGSNTIFNNTLWIGGYDAESQLHLAAEQYRQDGMDYFSGPLTVDGLATIEQSVVDAWNNIWRVSRTQIDEFQLCNNNSNYPLYEIPNEILNWPGNGDTGAGQAQNLAPYIDVNHDNIYSPVDGDYPNIPGDEALFFIFNDKAAEHTESDGLQLGIEVHAMAYAFNCNVEEAFQNTVFLKYTIINRSTSTYFDTYVGSFTDLDIGFGGDDYIGCDVGRGCYYGYNGDENDESSAGVVGYGIAPPAQAVVFLAGPLSDPDGIDNTTSYDTVNNVLLLNCAKGDILNGNINGLNFQDGIVDNERLGMTGFTYFNSGGNSATQSPGYSQEYHDYLKGLWLDGSSLCYGGNGHASGGGDSEVPTKFVFPGSPTSDPCGWGQGGIPKNDWSEETTSNAPGDRVGLGSSGPFTFLPNDTVELDLAFVYGRSTTTAYASVEQMLQNIDVIKNGYLNNITPCGTPFYYSGFNSVSNTINFAVTIFPNPANSNISIEINTNKNSNVAVSVMDINGRVYLKENISVHSGLSKSVLDISPLSSGIYFVAIDNGEIITNKKLVVLR